MTKVAIDYAITEQIRNVEGPIALVDSNGQTIGVLRRARRPRRKLNERSSEPVAVEQH
jgi:hypothetical protein